MLINILTLRLRADLGVGTIIIYAVLVVSIYELYTNRGYEFASEVDISISA